MTTRFFQLKWLLTTLWLVAAMAMPSMVWAAITPSKPTGGDGSTGNPYQISSAEHLYWFAALVNGTLTDGTAKNAAACAILTENITVNSGVLNSDGSLNTANAGSFTQWTPIGNNNDDGSHYTGTFDGNGKTISGLYFNNADICFIGLFGYNGGTVKNVGIVDSYFKGYHEVGGVCGQNYEGIIFNCYYQGTIVGDDVAGGICGYNSLSTIVNCYCSGSVSVTGSNAFFVGGVCGFSIYAVIENCYYNMDKCSEDVNGYYNFAESRSTMGKTTSQFQSGEVAYLLSEGRIIQDTTMTNIYDEKYILKGGVYDGSEWGQTLGTDNYPVLGGKEVFYGSVNCLTDEEGYSNSSTPHNYKNGFCTVCDDYQPAEYVDESHHPELLPEYRDYYAIENAGQLYWFAKRVNNDECTGIDAVLTDHITVNSGVIDSDGVLASNTSGFRPWTPIGWRNDAGTKRVLYNGIFDGNNHQITGLYFNDESTNNVGLLGYAMGTVRNLGIIGSYFKGGDNVGSMYGYGIARVINCFSFNCQVHGNTYVGGMCGRSYGDVSILCNSYITGTVSGTANVGSMYGLCEQESAIVANCYYDKEKCSIGAIGGSDVAGKAEGKTLAEFQSGKIAYLLSQGCTVGGEEYDGSNWGQWLKLLDYPTLGNLKVYYGYDTCDESAEKKYSNKSLTETRPNHSFDTNGFCTVCTSGYQPAELVSNTHHKELVETHNGYYAIENAGQLYWFAKQVNGGQTSKNAVLTANITVNSSVLKSDGTVNSANAGSFTTWTPIGNESNIYIGTFDGNGKTVSGLYLDNASMNYMGLFGYSNGTVKNVGVVDSYFHGRDYVGGVCGLNYGKILLCHSKSYLHGANSAVGGVCGANNSGSMTNSYNTGVVTGVTNVGGVCGYNYASISNCHNIGSVSGTNYVGSVCGQNGGTITNCYNNGDVSCTGSNIGGVCGMNSNTITSCYNTGTVTGTSEVGGVCGKKDGGTITSCYYLSGCNSEGTTFNDLGTAVSDADFIEEITFVDWDFTNVWEISGWLGRPILSSNPETNLRGTGTETNPFTVPDLETLALIRDEVNAGMNFSGVYFLLTADIDMSGTYNSASDKSWTPIGNESNQFKGTFDGAGHKITGLYINCPYEDYQGLFGYLGVGGMIKNLGVDGAVNGNDYVGGVCGMNNNGTISFCYNTSVITGESYFGGVCGQNHYGTISFCYNTGEVNGNDYVGGLCGWNEGTISYCYNIGSVTGAGISGGVCGINGNSLICLITGCYNTGAVTGTDLCGGVCGNNNMGTITGCYNTGALSGDNEVGGVCGQHHYGTISSCYNAGEVTGTNYVGGVCGDNDDGTITGCYYDSDKCKVGGIEGSDQTGKAEGRGTAEFERGEVCYLLNNSLPDDVWGQQLGTDQYPAINSAYKVLKAAQDGMEGDTYWATFSNLDSNAELMVPTGDITVYNATVSSGKMTLTPRSDNGVAKGEGVLLKADGEYVNAKNIGDDLTAATAEETNLVATPSTVQTITADAGYKLYRLTYNNASEKTGLGFYLGVVGSVKDGSQLKATPGKAYLKVASSETANARGFAFMEDEDDATGIRCVTVTDEASHGNAGNADDSMYDLGGRKVSNPAKGLYIRNGKKVIIK